jgi:DnaJ-class molecular chaperone
MTDHYATLGVAKTATANEIKQAFRRLASQHHPDKGGDTAKFQAIQAAYATLGDPQQRAAYDNPRPQMPPGFGFQSNGPFDFNTIFNMFGTRMQSPGQQRHQQARMDLWITIMDIATGGRRTVSVGSQQGTMTVEIEIPLGIEDGNTVHYSGIGPSGMDLLVTYRVHPHPRWQRNGLTLSTNHVLPIWDLILGCDTVFTDVQGTELLLTIPPKTQPGTQMRMKGRGLRAKSGIAGDMLVAIQARIPDNISPELLEMIKQSQTK